jgi:hypothetical protein
MISPSRIRQYLKNLPPGTVDLYMKTAREYFYAQMSEEERTKTSALVLQAIAITSGLSADTVMYVACVVGEHISRTLAE